MAKNSRKKKKTSKKSGLFSKKKIAIVLLACFSSFIVVYGINYFNMIQSQKTNDKETSILMDKMKKMLDDEKKRIDSLPKYSEPKKSKKLPPVIIVKQKKEKNIKKDSPFSEIQDYKKSLIKYPKKPLHVKKKEYSGKPKLAIIIDDVSFAHEVKLIKKIPYKVNPSFFPPTKRHPGTVKLSKSFAFKMVHLPTEAISYAKPEPETLKVGDSIGQIRKRIQQIKRWFPSIKYYNNHTGSKFTADLKSVDKLVRVMRDERLHFVDSRTTAQTKAPQIAKKYGLKLYSRDVFLDNSIDKNLIRKQIEKAISIAKKRGYAVAICHPHKNTLQVLLNAKSMFRDVELVYLKDL